VDGEQQCHRLQREACHDQRGPYTQVASPTSASYIDTSLSNGTTYYYVVSATNSAGESANSTQVSATPVAPVSIPATPTNLAATAGNMQASLTWSASSGATGYHVKRATTSGGPYTQVASPTAASYIDTSLSNGTTYYYVVSALNSAGESTNSTQVSALPAASNPPPTSGTWTNVTPSGVDLISPLCSNYGAKTVQVDPVHRSNLYTSFDCQGIWKSTDYGATWDGPINTGTNGAAVSECSGGIAIAPSSTASIPTIYQSCIRGGAGGAASYWISTDGGVDWTQHTLPTARQDYYPPVADPYDPTHLLMMAHEFDSILESTDSGVTWTSVPENAGMLQTNLAPIIFFIDTGVASTTRTTWLFIGDRAGGNTGTWRTVNGGTTWVQVDKNEQVAGTGQIYQPDTRGVIYMAGQYSALGDGVLRSTDYGQTWAHVGGNAPEMNVIGTPNNVYAMYGYPIGTSGSVDPAFELAAQPGTGTWAMPSIPAALSLEGVSQIAVTNDGTHNILVGAMWNGGVWRYVEP
jgi:hypothetical protein